MKDQTSFDAFCVNAAHPSFVEEFICFDTPQNVLGYEVFLIRNSPYKDRILDQMHESIDKRRRKVIMLPILDTNPE